MKTVILLITLFYFSFCNSNNKIQESEMLNEFKYSDVIEKDSVLYFKDSEKLFTGTITKSDSIGRIVKKIDYVNGLKHGEEIQYEYYYTDLPVVMMQGTWNKGKKVGIWKSHDGQGQMTVIKNYDKTE